MQITQDVKRSVSITSYQQKKTQIKASGKSILMMGCKFPGPSPSHISGGSGDTNGLPIPSSSQPFSHFSLKRDTSLVNTVVITVVNNGLHGYGSTTVHIFIFTSKVVWSQGEIKMEKCSCDISTNCIIARHKSSSHRTTTQSQQLVSACTPFSYVQG